MYQIDVMSRKPVYEQLVDQIERFILRDVLKADQQIQSVRSLSIELAVNPNTVQKAYSELDRRGIVYSVPGRGCFVSGEAKTNIGARKRNELHRFTETVEELALAGIKKKEVLDCVEQVYGRVNPERAEESAGGEIPERAEESAEGEIPERAEAAAEEEIPERAEESAEGEIPECAAAEEETAAAEEQAAGGERSKL